MATIETWTFAVATPPNIDLNGFNVEARDGKIGKVDEATHEVGGSFIVVDTGPWIFGKKVMLPAGMVREIDPDFRQPYEGRDQERSGVRREHLPRRELPERPRQLLQRPRHLASFVGCSREAPEVPGLRLFRFG
jgi:hypothetical protein